MIVLKNSIFFALIFFFTISTHAQTENGIKINIRKLSDRVLVLSGEEQPERENVVAIASKKGIIVIDTYPSVIYHIGLKG